MEFIESFLPPTALCVAYTALFLLRFENQRWVRLRNGGRKGSSTVVGAVVDGTYIVGSLFTFSFLLFVGWESGWRIAIGLFLMAQIIAMAYALFSVPIFGGDNFIIWVLSTLAIWPMMVYLTLRYVI
jgi:hypothetical protein